MVTGKTGDFVENELAGSMPVQGQCILRYQIKLLNDERLVEMVFCADLGCDSLLTGLSPNMALTGSARQGAG